MSITAVAETVHRAFQISGSVTMNESTHKNVKVGAKEKRKTKTIKTNKKTANGFYVAIKIAVFLPLLLPLELRRSHCMWQWQWLCVCVCLCLYVPIRELVTSEPELQLSQARVSAASAKIIWSSVPATEAAEQSDEGLTKRAPTSRNYFEMIFMLCQWNTIKIHIHRKRDRHSGVCISDTMFLATEARRAHGGDAQRWANEKSWNQFACRLLGVKNEEFHVSTSLARQTKIAAQDLWHTQKTAKAGCFPTKACVDVC